MLRNKLEALDYSCVSDEDFQTLSLPDHYSFSLVEIEYFVSKSDKYNLICTSKDYMKIPEKYRQYFIVADLDLEFYNEDQFVRSLESLITYQKSQNNPE